ncbi:MAG: chorismate synthase [Chlamydiia bacterium]|nr:chorismate synthase [Chlamydiia bacterium]
MASNSFGKLFRVTTWGESHGKAIGAVIDGCPAGLPITAEEINQELSRRKGGNSPYTTPRKENDQVEIFSGVFEGKTTGAPISLIIFNGDVDSSKYQPIKELLRPGHANFTYLEKYGIFDYRGGGRASARETACRVAAGAIAKKLLSHFDIEVTAYIHTIGPIAISHINLNHLHSSPLFCPDPHAEKQMIEALDQIKEEGDSYSGIVECTTSPLPVGLGDPTYEKLEANLAKAMLSLPASKGFEIGEGFHAARLKGSEHNDPYATDPSGNPAPTTNHAGGTLGGISTGLPLLFRVPFKPTSSIKKPQPTVDTQGNPHSFELPPGSRHDPCVAIRAVPIVEAMAACALADALLASRSSKL